MKPRKYTADNLVPMFLKAAQLRQEMIQAEFTDNGGAIHSAERIIDILGLHLKYPALSHRNGMKKRDDVEASVAAVIAQRRKKPVHVEHFYPLRAFTIAAIKAARPDMPGAEQRLVRFVKKHYRLVLLTPTERAGLDKTNRTSFDPHRLRGIKMAKRAIR